MGLLRAAFGVKMSDEQWRELEYRYGGCEGPTEQQDGRMRRWGEYKRTQDQRVAPSLDPELREEVDRRGGSMTIDEYWDTVLARSEPDLELADDGAEVGRDEPEPAARNGWFAARRAAHELGKAFGQLDIYEAEIKGSGDELDDPGWRQYIIDRIDQLVKTAPVHAVDEYIGFSDDYWPATTRQDYIDAWEDIKADMVQEDIEERLDEIDPLTREDEEREYAASYEFGDGDERGGDDDPTDPQDSPPPLPVTPELATDEPELTTFVEDELILIDDPEKALDEWESEKGLPEPGDVDLSEFEQQPYEPEPPTYLGYADGEQVRDARTGLTGHVRVRDDEEIGCYAEVQWDGSFVADQLEVALDNGLTRDGDVLDTELSVEDNGPVAGPQPATGGVAAAVLEAELDEPTASSTSPELEVDELGDTTAVVPELEVDEPELGDSDDDNLPGPGAISEELNAQGITEPELEVDEPETGPEPVIAQEQQPSSWWSTKMEQGRGKIRDKVQFAKDWIKELRSGRHRQCHGAWENHNTWGKPEECTIQVAKNEFGVSLEDITDAYGHPFVSEVLNKNDVQHKSYDELATFIHRTQLQGRDLELERE